ncbi:MAG: methionyl-tRNA formyltransferase [Bdellovibrio sp.]|nr:methionyl-tRNA formyltransferase [Bdellovibrio sp.]
MKIALFTSNQARHLHLMEKLSEIASEVLVVSEVTTVFPGATQDFYNKSDVMKEYFQKMQEAEQEVFGASRFLPANLRLMPLKMGDLNSLPVALFNELKEVDYIVVFGASWIKGELCDLLVQKKAINIHMGISPYYRGAACNFWAIYDGRVDFVGATVHYLSKGLDSGDMIFHALPKAEAVGGFKLGMLAVRAAHLSLCKALQNGSLFSLPSVKQDKDQQIRYSKRAEFNDEVAKEFLLNPVDPKLIHDVNSSRDLTQFLNPQII